MDLYLGSYSMQCALFLSLILETHGSITEVISYYFESIINASIRVIGFLFQI